jgi:nitrate reductase NapAB chaperone NapD
MGMRTDSHIQIINLTIEGKKEDIRAMSNALSQIKEISIKTTYAQHKGDHDEQ